MTIDHCRVLFGISESATLQQVKDAYRKRVKQHHPDQFADDEDKLKQTGILGSINEAYRILLEHYRSFQKKDPATAGSDYNLYKKGLEYYQIYFDSFFQLFAKRKVKTANEKTARLKRAVFYFNKLMQDYPGSEWVNDVKEKLKDIEKAMHYLRDEKR
ncbi:MAG: DnaJ domain-containing protein [Spirochaetales bacterium]|nr:DnaJ domain-containing protein [Spirochaetales bacterium]